VARIVCVHGIAQQYKGEETLHGEWSAALRDGLRLAGPAGREVAASLTDSDLRDAFYGNAFRPPGQRILGVGDPLVTIEDLTDFERDLVGLWWEAAAQTDPGVVPPDARTLLRWPGGVQAGLRALSCARFFAGLAERAMVADLVQVRRYFTEPDIRAAAQQQVLGAVDDNTRVLVGHSLGSVVAYEALCAHPEWPVHTLVTLGSPLGIRHLIFDRLQPTPLPPIDGSDCGVGHWPGNAKTWVNVADDGDVVALVKDLRPQFGPSVACYLVHNGAKAHDIRPYLTAPETGAAILGGLERS
jgi:hypothetical protein